MTWDRKYWTCSCGCGTLLAVVFFLILPLVVNERRASANRIALSYIMAIETALTEVLADAGTSSLETLLNPDGIRNYMKSSGKVTNWPPISNHEFLAASRLYSSIFIDILKHGRLTYEQTHESGFEYSQVLKADRSAKLGTAYIDVGEDPWGAAYNIFPGPWKSGIPIPFRISHTFGLDSSKLTRDEFVVGIIDEEFGERIETGFPAPKDKLVYIWSNGPNLLSSQMLYSAIRNPGAPLYDTEEQNEYFQGGGDDINNWSPKPLHSFDY